ncbi:hypothetical protein ACEPAG_3645 [Sanghuangporus baumii]
MRTGYDEVGSSPELALGSHQRSHPHRFSTENHSHSSSGQHCTVGSDPSSERLTNEAGFKYLDDILADSHEDSDKEGRTVCGQLHLMQMAASESSNSHSPETSQLDLLRDRTPSLDFQPKVNPWIASLRYESGCRSPSPSLQSSPGFDIATILVPSSPTLAIPTPRISPAHQEEHARIRSPPESPALHAGLLSPEILPRVRSDCASPVSDSATSSSIVRSGIGGALGTTHTGREIRDGRCARLYRKTSEDFKEQSAQSDGREAIVLAVAIEKASASSPTADLKSQGTRALERVSSGLVQSKFFGYGFLAQ